MVHANDVCFSSLCDWSRKLVLLYQPISLQLTELLLIESLNYCFKDVIVNNVCLSRYETRKA